MFIPTRSDNPVVLPPRGCRQARHNHLLPYLFLDCHCRIHLRKELGGGRCICRVCTFHTAYLSWLLSPKLEANKLFRYAAVLVVFVGSNIG